VISSRKAPQLVQSGFLDLGPLRVHHMQGGRGPAVLFIHGLGSSGYMEWRRNLEPTATRHRVYAPDLPGYGRTDMEDRGLRSAALIGASLGGRIALEVALDRPGLVRKLALVNTLGLGRPKVRTAQVMYGLVTIPRFGEAVMGVARDALAWAPRTMIRRFAARYSGASADLTEALDDAYLSDLREMYAADGYRSAYLSTVRSLVNPRALFGGHHDVTRRLNELKIPVQLIWGADDPLFPLAHAERARALIGKASLAVIKGAGHTPQAERPEEFNRVLDDFLG